MPPRRAGGQPLHPIYPLGLRAKRMPSGAVHDAQVLAAVTDAGMVFVPSQGGRSHRPDEWTDWVAIEPGGNVLLHALIRLASA